MGELSEDKRITFEVFLFQAEDDIREAQESRGVGDVNKGQAQAHKLHATQRSSPSGSRLSIIRPRQRGAI